MTVYSTPNILVACDASFNIGDPDQSGRPGAIRCTRARRGRLPTPTLGWK
jgi:hypothetical protein